MNLCIDIGNTLGKVAVFKGAKMLGHWRVQMAELAEFLEREATLKVCRKALVCSVAGKEKDVCSVLERMGIQASALSSRTRLPFQIDYLTPQTLGPDRLAVVAGACELWPQENVLIVDAGSCVTYELLLKDGHYKGGNIAPGMRMRFLSMHEHTKRLPMVETNGEASYIGQDTHSALLAGVLRGMQFEIEGYSRYLQHRLGSLRAVLTGGDAQQLQQLLTVEAQVEQHLLLKGLDYILRYNEQETK